MANNRSILGFLPNQIKAGFLALVSFFTTTSSLSSLSTKLEKKMNDEPIGDEDIKASIFAVTLTSAATLISFLNFTKSLSMQPNQQNATNKKREPIRNNRL